MKKLEVISKIFKKKIIAVIREDDPDIAFDVARACITGGIECLEIALTTPCGLDVIESLAKDEGLLVGAGTVLDSETARAAIQVGASFIVSPLVEASVVQMCSRHGVVAISGAFTPTEIVGALDAGADLIKLFPANALGPKYFESVAAPLPQAPLVPVGGVTLENFSSWFVGGVVAVGLEGDLTTVRKKGDYAPIANRARQFVSAAASLSAPTSPLRV